MWERYFIVGFVITIGIYIGLSNFKKLSLPFKWLTITIICVLFSDTFGVYLAYQGNSNPSLHLLVPVLVLCFSVIFSSFRKNKKVFLIISPLLILFSGLNLIFFQTIYDFPTYPLMLMAIGVTMAALFDFKRILESPTSINITQLPVFWFDLGTLIFYSITFFIFSLTNMFFHMRPIIIIWFVAGFNVFMYGCYGLGIYFDSKRPLKV